jgi:hypothetical protein
MSSITDGIKEIWLGLRFELYFSMIMNVLIFLAVANIIILIYSPTSNFHDIIDIGEKAALFIVAVTGLAFTYGGAVLDNPKKARIIESGEYFLRSFLTFVIGMVFSIGIKQTLMNPSKAFFFPWPLNYLEIIGWILFYVISLALLIISGVFFC